MVDICLLGTGGMMPLPDRWLASLLVRIEGRMILIDCGEGTQIPIKMAGWGFKNIDILLLTHYHADHVSGLPGLLLTIGNSGRIEPLIIAGPPGLKNIVDGLTVVSPELPFEIKLIELSDTESSLMHPFDNKIEIRSLPVDHRIPCLSYSIGLTRVGLFNSNAAIKLGIPVSLWNLLQRGESVTIENRVIMPEMVLGEPRKGIKVGYCTDTRPIRELAELIRDSDLLVCEGMYGAESDFNKAVEKKHMLFSEAANLAVHGAVQELWLTHFSPSLTEPEQFLESAATIFNNSFIGKDLMKRTIKY